MTKQSSFLQTYLVISPILFQADEKNDDEEETMDASAAVVVVVASD